MKVGTPTQDTRLSQKYETTWSHDNNTEVPEIRSGNPGLKDLTCGSKKKKRTEKKRKNLFVARQVRDGNYRLSAYPGQVKIESDM